MNLSPPQPLLATLLIFLLATVDFQYLGREKWNIRQQNSIIKVRIPLFPLMAGGENIVKLVLFLLS